MPAFEGIDLIDKAVLWPVTGYDKHEKPVVGDPEEIRVRAERALGGVGSSNNTADATMDVKVGRQIDVGSMMWVGPLSELTDRVPSSNPIMEVVSYKEVPDLKGRNVTRMIRLAKVKGSTPGGLVVDLQMSSVTVNKIQAIANDYDEIVCTVKLRTSDDLPVPDRVVYLARSTDTGISFHNSPQISDADGEAIFRLRAFNATSLTITASTSQDGLLHSGIAVSFVLPGVLQASSRFQSATQNCVAGSQEPWSIVGTTATVSVDDSVFSSCELIIQAPAFSIPANATILGATVTLQLTDLSVPPANNARVEFLKWLNSATSLTSDDFLGGHVFQNPMEEVVAGSATSLFNLVTTPTHWNNGDVKLELRVSQIVIGPTPVDVSVRFDIDVTVYYQVP